MTSPKLKGSKKARLSMARLAAVQCVYQWLQSGGYAKDILDYYDEHFTGLHDEEGELLPPDRELLSGILQGVQKRFDEVENMIDQHINKSTEGIDSNKDLIVRATLYCGGYELLVHHDLDAPLIISDYLHVTKSFYEGSEVKLVNGILDALKTTLDR